MTMNLPLVLKGDSTSFLIAGGGNVAQRKIRTLMAANCSLVIVAPELPRVLQEQIHLNNRCQWQQFPASADLNFGTADFVVLATDDAPLNALLANKARQEGRSVCRVDQTQDNDFIFPAVIDRSPLLVTVSSSGSSPALTRHLKERLEAFIPQEYSALGRMVESLRQRIKELLPAAQRAAFWRRWMSSNVPELVLSRQPERAEYLSEQLIAGATSNTGEVYLVGAGPGDPDLLTFRALRLIQSADVVYYDRLVNPRILEFISPEAERFYVGKAKSDHAVPQHGINQLLIDSARKGKRVLRLKGGDPFIFGRGGEEIEQLADAGIPFQVVPGITAASGCAAYSGIPLTHRDYAQSVRFVTGHLKDGSCDLPWHELIYPQQTLVIYMGLTGVPLICQQLIGHGMVPSTPIALIEKGTLPDQKVHISTIADMPEYVRTNTLHAPTLTIVGDVVSLYEKLSWR